MSSDISYWLAEVESLQKQLQETQQQRDEAYRESYNWRQRYETEARQRRRETQQFQAEVQTLKETIAQLKAQSDLAPAGKIPAGSSPAGKIPAGSSPAGKIPAGNSPANKIPAGKIPAGNNHEDSAELPAEWLQEDCSLAELQHQVQILWQERDRYRQALGEERRAHNQTRQNLTLALGDAVDQLKCLKQGLST